LSGGRQERTKLTPTVMGVSKHNDQENDSSSEESEEDELEYENNEEVMVGSGFFSFSNPDNVSKNEL